MIRTTAKAAATATANGASPPPPGHLSRLLRTHLVFGANTDVGKTVLTAGLLRAALLRQQQATSSDSTITTTAAEAAAGAHYVKPLQCGGSDEAFVDRYATLAPGSASHTPQQRRPMAYSSRTLFRWETAASPHLASRVENRPVSDGEVLGSVRGALESIRDSHGDDNDGSGGERGKGMILIETAGGVLSPSSASPDNALPCHARGSEPPPSPSSWGWSTQADLYRPLSLPSILVGDGRLGGISCTLSALESLLVRSYDMRGIVLIDDGGGYDNVTALREYASRRPVVDETAAGVGDAAAGSCCCLRTDPARSIVSLPPLPPEPEPLDGWYRSSEVEEKLEGLNGWLEERWEEERR